MGTPHSSADALARGYALQGDNLHQIVSLLID
jgi:hypothetical protein